MKTLKKFSIICVVFFLIFAIMQNNIYAFQWSSEISSTAEKTGDPNVTGSVTNIAKSVVTITRVICVGVAITMLVVLAIKYMASAPSDRASVKKGAVIYVVGAIIMFAASGILGIIQNFAGVIE